MFMGVSRDLLEESICYLDKIIARIPIPNLLKGRSSAKPEAHESLAHG